VEPQADQQATMHCSREGSGGAGVAGVAGAGAGAGTWAE